MIERIEARIGEIKKEISRLGDLRPGSLSRQYNVCGNPSCRCKDKKNPQKHGPYTILSYVLGGRHTTEFVKDHQVEEVKKQLSTYKRLRDLMAEWVVLSVRAARLRRESTKAVRVGGKEAAR